MLRNLNYFILVVVSVITISSNHGFADETKKADKITNDNSCIRISMTTDDFIKVKCKDFVPFPEKKIKHQIKDSRFRKYYHYKPLLSVVMKESDINSYFEIIFSNEKLAEINQYDLQGQLINKHTKIYCSN